MLKTVRNLFPDESLDVIVRELRASGWVVANAIDALDALRDLRQQHHHHRPPLPRHARNDDPWVVLDSTAAHPPEGSSLGGDGDGRQGSAAEGVRQVEDALRKSCLWDDPQAFVTHLHPPVGAAITTDAPQGTEKVATSTAATAAEAQSSGGGGGGGGEVDPTGGGGTPEAEERRKRAERQRQMLEEADRRWEEEKQRQAEAERLHARLKEHRQRYGGSLPRPNTATATAGASASAAGGAESDEAHGTREQGETKEARAHRKQEQEQRGDGEELREREAVKEKEGKEGKEGKEEDEGEAARARQEERERQQVALAGMVALCRKLAQRFTPQQLEAMRAIPFTVTTERAAKIFNDWRLSLWFAPTDFSQLLEAPSVSMTYVPYYCTAVRSVCTYAARVEVAAGTDGRKESRLVEGRRREGSHEQNVCGAARLRPEVAALLSAIEPWDMEASLPLATPPPPSSATRGSLPLNTEDDDDNDTVRVASLLEPRDVWGTVREAIVAREKEECARELLAGDHEEDESCKEEEAEEEEKGRERVVRVVETSVTRMEYPETRYRVVYVPLYLVRYTQGDPQGEPREFFFAINALTGKSHGQRPFGVGKILGRGLSFLEGLLGLKDHHTAQIVIGSQLSQLDRRICYADKDYYLIWPASHSYVLAHDTGFITLRNCSATRPIALSSQMRESKDITARYVLRPGETQSFNYRGFWCIRLALASDDDDEAGQAATPPSALSRAATFFFPATAQPAPVSANGPVRWEEMIEVVGYSIDGGNHGNLLGMA